HAHDPAQDHRREGPRRPLDPRPYAHHRSAGSARHGARRDAGARPRTRPRRARGEIRRLSGLSMNFFRHPEVRAKRASKGDGSQVGFADLELLTMLISAKAEINWPCILRGPPSAGTSG